MMGGLGAWGWQSGWAMVLLLTSWKLIRARRDEHLYSKRRAKLYLWLSVFALVLSLLPIGFHVSYYLPLDPIWAKVISGGSAIGSFLISAFKFLKDGKVVDVEKDLNKLILCAIGFSLGLATGLAWREFFPVGELLAPPDDEQIRT